MSQDIFELFKKNKNTSYTAAKATDQVFFQLDFDDAGAFLRTVDKKTKP
jgi:hypothetical protein